MSIEKDRAFAEVLRQLSTAELLDRYYRQTPELTDDESSLLTPGKRSGSSLGR